MVRTDPPPVVPALVDRSGLVAEHRRLRVLRRDLAAEHAPLGRRVGAFFAWFFARFMALFPVRVVAHYMFHGGPLMAAGLAYQLLFASTALLVIFFAALATFLGTNSPLQQNLVAGLVEKIPGLLDVGDGRGGVIPLRLLEDTGPFTVASTVAVAVLLFTAWRWVAGVRLATRRMFELPPAPGVPMAAVPRDLGWLVVIGVLLLASATVSVFASGAVDGVIGWLGDIGLTRLQPWLDGGVKSAVTFAVGLVVDCVMSFSLVRGVAQLKLHRKALAVTVVVGAAGSQVLRYGGSEVIGRAGENPYLLSAAVLVGVLLWFNLYGQILLLAAASGAVVQADIRGARAQPEREKRAVTAVAVSALPDAARGRGHEAPVSFGQASGSSAAPSDAR
ncbi:YihY/virulence factor BrkB family protein [Kocuria rhizophila]|uniref:YihY/virulence factor BrkB family protein n=1 Tax=Kocuria rhizophila TaxID=72000 RepID=UPI001E00CF5D|nr:YihY/virulence factor BrkB family protein [Kocuria rhizophila]MCC5674301.1 YihY/virulence factor BrkB family protein [Kocuria rhizophila]